MTVDINLLKNRTHVRPDSFEGATGWTWVSDANDMTWPLICQDWQTHHKQNLVDQFPNGGRSAIMAGGNCGLYPALLSQYFNLVYTFEPDPENFHCLANNCQFPNIIKMQAALGVLPGMAKISQKFIGNVGMTRVAPFENDAIPVLPIDSFDFQDLDLIWLDTEGYELKILQGALYTLARLKPKLVLELGDVVDGQPGNKERVVDWLAQIGYTKVSHLGNIDYLIQHEEA